MGFGAVVLTGGAARRMGGADKPAVPVGGQPMRDRVLAAVADASPLVVVGPATGLPSGVLATRENPPGGGPVAAAAAGFTLLGPDITTVALLAGDLPLLTAGAVRVLRRRLAESGLAESGVDGVVYLDSHGRRQMLCGVWRIEPMSAALIRLASVRGGTLAGASMHALLDGLKVAGVSWRSGQPGPPPWFDCDTDDDVRRAEEWAS